MTVPPSSARKSRSWSAGAAPTLRYGPTGDSAPRLRLRWLVWAERFLSAFAPNMNDNILYHALAARPPNPTTGPPLSPHKQSSPRIGPEQSRARSGEANP